jgi:ribosomal protein S18 acetylase RimI-like enzyme
MLLAGPSLAHRIEAAEQRLSVSLAAAASRAGTDAFALPLAGGAAVFAGAGSPFNKVIGLGFAGPLEPADLAAIEAAYVARGAPIQVELSTLAEPSIAPLLTGRGYALVGFEDVLGRALAPADAAPPAGPVEVAPTDDDPAWVRTVCAGFGAPDLGPEGGNTHESFSQETLERVFGHLLAAPGFRRYLARIDGTVAGGASLRIDDGVAQLCGASTLPALRRRGVQTALLRARLADAARTGCDVATMTTAPGSKSQHNARRQGFELLYTRAILVRRT